MTAKYFELAARMDKAPVWGYSGSLFRVVTNAFLRNDASFLFMALTWHALDANQPPPEIPADPDAQDPENLMASHFYVTCGDTQWPRSVQTYQRDVAVDRTRYPVLGAASANIGPCAFWPVNPVAANKCANDAVTTFLTTGQRPARDAFCAAQS